MIYEQAFSIESSLGGPTDTLTALLVKHFTILFQANSVVPLKLIVFTMLPAKLFSTCLRSYFKAFFAGPVRIAARLNLIELI
jgi:hypothetical protein